MLKVENLTICFSDRETQQKVVSNVSFSIEKGEILGIVGESGSGKTMTALTIAGLLKRHAKVDEGTISFIKRDGKEEELLSLSEREMRKLQGDEIDMIFQEPMTALNPTMRIGEQIEEALRLHTNLSKEEREQRVLKALEDVELYDSVELRKKYPHELSGGMRQRVMIAAAIVCRPRLLIADEPTTALDVNTQKSILQLLKKLNQKYRMGILFISHNLRVVNMLCERVLVMKDGEIVETGKTETIFTNPKQEYTKKLIAALPKQLPGECETEDAEVPLNKRETCEEHGNKVLELRHVNAFYREGKVRRQVLKDVSFTLYEGEIVGLVGESGSGKSTLCKSILGLVKEYDGEVMHYTKYPQMVFQDPYSSLNPKRTIGKILEEPLLIRKDGTKTSRRQQAEVMLEKVHLPREIFGRYPKELSGGQRQRVSLASALMTGSRFILADEALSALDVTVQAQMIRLLKELQKEECLTYLFVSHDLDVVRMICDRILVLEEGRVREVSYV